MPGRITLHRETLPTRDGGPMLYRYVVMHDDRRIGFIPPGKTHYFTFRREGVHFSFKLQGYGIDKEVVDWIDTVPTLETVVLVIRHEDGRQHAYITPSMLWLFARPIELSADFGPQCFVRFTDIQRADETARKALMRAWPDHNAVEYYPPIEAIEA